MLCGLYHVGRGLKCACAGKPLILSIIQLKGALAAEIIVGCYPVHERLPSERERSEKYKP